jgi:hypothetical protein
MKKNSLKNNIADTNDIIEIEMELTSFIKSICDLSEKISEIIKKSGNETKENNFIADKEIEKINNFYKERDLLVKKLQFLIEKNGNELLNNNLQWKRYVNDIVPIEKENIDFLKKKVNETKLKLTELYQNKSLMIYNKKEDLSYENRIL